MFSVQTRQRTSEGQLTYLEYLPYYEAICFRGLLTNKERAPYGVETKRIACFDEDGGNSIVASSVLETSKPRVESCVIWQSGKWCTCLSVILGRLFLMCESYLPLL